MKKSLTSTKKFYKKHAEELRVSGRILKILQLMPKWIYKRDILDVGCGNGFITTCMKVYANDVNWIDIEENIVTYSEDKQYDAVTCFDVLEHIPPAGFEKALCNILNLCKDEGYIIINQPEQQDKSQPLDQSIELDMLYPMLGTLQYLERYAVGSSESYNFMVFKK